MTITKIFDVEKLRDEDHVHYIVKYSAKAEIEFLNQISQFEFIFEVELHALGKHYKIVHVADVNYPIVEIVKQLKNKLKEIKLSL